MNLYLAEDNEFIDKLSKIILDNLGNENFGVKEFITAAGLNRNYLSRRIKSIKKITVNQFITEVRLEKAREFLLEGTYTATEVSNNVGFSSPSYFSKCFHDFYGYAPSEVKKHLTSEKTEKPESRIPKPKPELKKRWVQMAISAAIFMVVVVISSEVFYYRSFEKGKNKMENTIAIMPFINDSGEEFAPFTAWMGIEIGNKLGKIENMLVVPQSTTETYRDSKKATATLPAN
jgi:AraC-like DNA-binding protein